MMTVLLIAAYACMGAGVGKLWANTFLNKEYQKRIKNLNTGNWKYGHGSEEEYLVWLKEQAYEYALENSDVDRKMSMAVSLLGWPITMFIVLGHYIYKLANRIPTKGPGLSAAARDVRKTQKNVTKAIAERELKNEKIREWNNMVDILNENKLNDITKYEKRKELK